MAEEQDFIKSFLFHFFHKLITLFHFSLAGKNEHIFLCMLLRKQGYHVSNFAKKSIKLQMLALKKLSRLLVQRIKEFKMNEIQRKTPQ